MTSHIALVWHGILLIFIYSCHTVHMNSIAILRLRFESETQNQGINASFEVEVASSHTIQKDLSERKLSEFEVQIAC